MELDAQQVIKASVLVDSVPASGGFESEPQFSPVTQEFWIEVFTMAQVKADVVQLAKSSTVAQTVKLSQLFVSEHADYCHREGDNFRSSEALSSLVDSIVSEGLHTPLTVSEIKSDVGGPVRFEIIGGHRREAALRKIIQDNLDVSRFHEHMEIPVVVVQPDANQSQAEFRNDLFFKSIADNSMRKDFTNEERNSIVKKCIDQQVPRPRAARALGLSEKQFQRIAMVVATPWLLVMVNKNQIGMTQATLLVEAAEKDAKNSSQKLERLRSFLHEWVAEMQEVLDEEIAIAKKIKKPLTGVAATVRKYIKPTLFNFWLDCLTNDKDFKGKASVSFGIHVDEKNGKITVPAIEFKVKDGELSTLMQMIDEFQQAADDALILLEDMEYQAKKEKTPKEERKKEAQARFANRKRSQDVDDQSHRGREVNRASTTGANEVNDVDVTDEYDELDLNSVNPMNSTSDSESYSSDDANSTEEKGN